MPTDSGIKKFNLLIIIMLISVCYTQGQQKVLSKRITVSKKNISIRNIIKYTADKYEISYTFRSDMTDLNIKKDINLKEQTVRVFLTELLKGTKLRYICYSNQIILTESHKPNKNQIFKGQIFDSETKQTIAYTGILFLKSGEGLITDYSGRFELQYKKDQTDSIRISSLSYEAKTIALKDLRNHKTKIFLTKKFYKINRVEVNASDFFSVRSGNKGFMATGSVYIDTHGQQAALFVENPKLKEGIVKSVSFRLSGKGNVSAPFRIRIYSPDSSLTKPHKDLLRDIIVVRPEGSGWFTAELSQYRIVAPPQGFFVAMEGIYPPDFNAQFQEQDFKELNKKEADINNLAYGQRLSYNIKHKNRTWHYSLSHRWFQTNKNRFNVMIKAKIRYNKKHLNKKQ